MLGKRELVARIAETSESIAASGQVKSRDFAGENDLTLPQIRTLYLLVSGPARITDISQAQEMARPNASNMVERLVKKGLVERVSDPNDRRVALARLTDRGREAVEAVNRSSFVAIERVAAFLSIDELELVAQAMEVLKRGVERLKAANGDDLVGQAPGD